VVMVLLFYVFYVLGLSKKMKPKKPCFIFAEFAFSENSSWLIL